MLQIDEEVYEGVHQVPSDAWVRLRHGPQTSGLMSVASRSAEAGLRRTFLTAYITRASSFGTVRRKYSGRYAGAQNEKTAPGEHVPSGIRIFEPIGSSNRGLGSLLY